MRILHIVHQYPPDFSGGTELYTQALARRQAGLGHSVAVLAPSTLPPEGEALATSDEEGLRAYRVRLGPRGRGRVFWDTFGRRSVTVALDAILAREKPDLAHIQHLMGLPAGLAQRLRAAGIPYLVTLHDYYYFCANAQLLTNDSGQICDGPVWWVNCGRCALARAGLGRLAPLGAAVAPVMALRQSRLGQALAGADTIIAPTRFVAQAYRRMGLGGEKILVLPHGIALAPAQPLAPVRRAPGEPLRVVYIGGLAWQKGIHILVAAVNRLPGGAVRLAIHGNESAFPDYVAQLKALAAHPGITFGGPLDRGRLWATLAAADVLVAPSIWYEVAPMVILEAFYAGLPIVASNLGGLAELIHHGEDGLLVPPGDDQALAEALALLSREPERLAALRAAIRPVRTSAEHVSDIMALYDQILTRRPAS
jgi:glycosyltransferase involved in cell wall biosynthesis